jgi:hypothetical protein
MTTSERGEKLREWKDAYELFNQRVPLFAATEDLTVETKAYGYDDRPILARSDEADNLIRKEANKVVTDWQNDSEQFEGLLYILLNEDGEMLYVGKAGKYGRDGEKLSANLKNLSTSTSKFARWGDGYAYHLGELSAAVLNHHTREDVNRDEPPKPKYQAWNDAMFKEGRELKEQVYLWVRAWQQSDKGMHGFENSLETVEKQLIDMASHVAPDTLLNIEGK